MFLPEDVRRASQHIADELGLSFPAVAAEALSGWRRARLVDAWLAEYQAEYGAFDECELRSLADLHTSIAVRRTGAACRCRPSGGVPAQEHPAATAGRETGAGAAWYLRCYGGSATAEVSSLRIEAAAQLQQRMVRMIVADADARLRAVGAFDEAAPPGDHVAV